VNRRALIVTGGAALILVATSGGPTMFVRDDNASGFRSCHCPGVAKTELGKHSAIEIKAKVEEVHQ
jgi:uncharacterized protein YodC (DUF2158 family)